MLISFFLIISVALGNLFIGYTIAVYLGYGLPLSQALFPAPLPESNHQSFEDDFSELKTEEQATVEEEIHGLESEEQESDSEVGDDLYDLLESNQDKPQDEESRKWEQAGESLLDELLEVEPTEENSPFEQTYEAVFFEITRFSDELAKWDRKLREWSGAPPEEEGYQDCVDNLTQSVYRTQEGLQSAVERIMKDGNTSEESERLRRKVHDILDELSEQYNEQINSLLSLSLDEMQHDDTVQEMMETCQRLLTLCHDSRSQLEETLIEIANLDNGLHNSDINSHEDEYTGLSDRLGFEAALADWWRNDPNRARSLSLAVIDLDQQGDVNRDRGALIGDQLLYAVGKLVLTSCRDNDVAARVAGQQFVFLYGDTEPQEAVHQIESLRQTIAKARFQCNEEEITTSVSAAVSTPGNGEDSLAILRRLREVLRQSKQQQRNYTVLCDSETSTAVEPAELEVEEQCIPIEV